jgi:hypothetical protein
MPTMYAVMAALQKQVSAAVTGVAPAPIQCAVGWPPVTALQNLARNGGTLISVYDRKVGRNTTRWSAYAYNRVVVPATLTTVVNAPTVLPPTGSGSLTLGGATVTAGDAVSLVAITPQANAPSKTAAVVVIGAGSDTPSSMATNLANAINADATLSAWLLATTAGPMVNLNNLTAQPIALQSYAGNGGSQTLEVGRRESQLQITVWNKTQPNRATAVSPITSLLGTLQNNFGLTLADGATQARLTMENDYAIEDDTLEDVYRHDFLTRLEYPITTQDVLFAVLAPVPAFAVQN